LRAWGAAERGLAQNFAYPVLNVSRNETNAFQQMLGRFLEKPVALSLLGQETLKLIG
jgi:hypothetical protein